MYDVIANIREVKSISVGNDLFDTDEITFAKPLVVDGKEIFHKGQSVHTFDCRNLKHYNNFSYNGILDRPVYILQSYGVDSVKLNRVTNVVVGSDDKVYITYLGAGNNQLNLFYLTTLNGLFDECEAGNFSQKRPFDIRLDKLVINLVNKKLECRIPKTLLS